MKKFLIALLCVLLVVSFAACGTKTDDSSKGDGEATGLTDGTYKYASGVYGKTGYMDIAEMTVEGGKITALTFDCYTVDGQLKSDIVAAGNYVMTENGPTWTEQAKAVADYIIANQSTEGIATSEGKADTTVDALSTVSITVTGFTAAADDLIAQATPGYTAEAAKYTDGVYSYEGAEFGSSGYKDLAEMTVYAGKVVALKFDSVKEDGTLKRDEVAAGSYVMTEDGPTWTEQANIIAQQIVMNGSTEGIATTEGKADTTVDALATVSITVTGFTAAADDLFTQAAAK